MNKLSSAVSPVRARRFRLAACACCRGDALLDLLDGEWRCLQCGRTVSAAGTGSPGRAREYAGASAVDRHAGPTRGAARGDVRCERSPW